MNAPPKTASAGTTPATIGASTTRHPAILGLLAGARAIVIGLGIVAVPVLLSWLTAGSPRASLSAAARTSAAVWLAAHRTTITTPTGQITLVPLGLTVVLAGVCWWSARRVAAARPDRRRAETAAAHLGFILAYASGALVVALGTASVAARPHVETALLGGVVLSALASAQPWWFPGRRGAPRRGAPSGPENLADRENPARLARAVFAIVGFASAVSTILVSASLLIHYSRVRSLYGALDPGPGGAIGLGVVHLAAFPLLVVWGLAWLAGPGFSVGLGTSVTSSGTTLGPLPALPLLGVLPTPGENPFWLTPLAAGVFVLAGALAGGVLAAGGRARAPRVRLWQELITTAALAGVVVGLLSWWASGSMGSAAMSVWGPDPLRVTVLVTGETLLGAAATAWAWPAVRRRRPGRAQPAD